MSSLTPEERRERYGKFGESNGMFGRTHTDEVKKKLSKIHKGNSFAKGAVRTPEQRARMSEVASKRTGEKNPFYGKHHSDATKEKIRKVHLGKSNVACSKKISIDGIVYDSLAAASKALGIHISTLSHRARNNNPKFSNYFYI